MNILLVLIPISLLLLGIAIAAFVWAVKRGQYDDLDTPALDILIDDQRPAPRRDAPRAARAFGDDAVDVDTHADGGADLPATNIDVTHIDANHIDASHIDVTNIDLSTLDVAIADIADVDGAANSDAVHFGNADSDGRSAARSRD